MGLSELVCEVCGTDLCINLGDNLESTMRNIRHAGFKPLLFNLGKGNICEQWYVSVNGEDIGILQINGDITLMYDSHKGVLVDIRISDESLIKFMDKKLELHYNNEVLRLYNTLLEYATLGIEEETDLVLEPFSARYINNKFIITVKRRTSHGDHYEKVKGEIL